MKRKRLSKSQRNRIYEMCGGSCAYCGCKIKYEEMQIDHVRPLCNGGTDTMDNMLPSCRSCNHRKNGDSVEEFRKCVERFLTILNRDSVTYRNAVRFGLITPNLQKVVFYFERLAK